MTDAQEITSTNIPTKKVLLWIAMGSMLMLFAALTSGYIVRQAEGNWNLFEVPTVFYYSTVVLFVSSFSMFFAVRSAKRGDMNMLRNALLVTLLLGITFVFLQYAGWKDLVQAGITFTGKTSNPSGSFFYVLTGLHLAHLAGGLLALIYGLYISLRYRQAFDSKRILSIELASIFWHFLDLLWIYLFIFLLFVR